MGAILEEDRGPNRFEAPEEILGSGLVHYAQYYFNCNAEVKINSFSGHFRKLVDQAGKSEAARLEMLADEARKLRQVVLLQSQVAYPGSELTSSKSKSEILKHFGSRIVFETTL